MMKAQGKDYGGYTIVDESQVKPGFETDFKIVGIAWGTTINPTWESNKPDVKKEKRRILYHFYNHGDPWEEQADLILREYEDVKAHAFFEDWERSSYGVRPDKDMSRQAYDMWKILNKVKNNVGGRVGGYSNFYDYWLLIHNMRLSKCRDDINKTPWWFADPNDNPDGHPGSYNLWQKYALGRKLYDYHFDQWSWKGYAPDYGAVNNKKSMDLTQHKYSLAELDKWLGINGASPPPPPQPDPNKLYNLALDELEGKILEAKRELRRE